MTCTCETYVPNPNAPTDVTIAKRNTRCPQHGDAKVYVLPGVMRMRSEVHRIREFDTLEEIDDALRAIESTLDDVLDKLGAEKHP